MDQASDTVHHGEVDAALQQDPAQEEVMEHVDHVSALYPCPHCGLDRPVMDFYSEGAHAYNPYCSICMAGYAEAMVLHHHQTENGLHGDVGVGLHAHARHEAYPHTGGTLGHEHLNVQQLLAAQVIDADPTNTDHAGVMMSHQQFLMPQVLPTEHGGSVNLGYDPHAMLPYSMADPHTAAALSPDTVLTKMCSKCKLAKPFTDFPWLKDRRRGRAAHCSSCRPHNESHNAQEGQLDEAGVGEGDQALYLPTVAEKRCAQCAQVKPAAAFRKIRNKTDHLQNRCKDCERVLGRGTKRDPAAPRLVRITHKLCIRCSIEKPAEDFFTSKTSLDGLLTYCKDCQKALSQAARKKRTELLKQNPTPALVPPQGVPSMKQCKVCGEDKDADQFYKSSNNADGLYTYCKTCSTKKNTAGRKMRRQKKGQKGQESSGDGNGEAAPLVGDDGAAMAVGNWPMETGVQGVDGIAALSADGGNMQYDPAVVVHQYHHHQQQQLYSEGVIGPSVMAVTTTAGVDEVPHAADVNDPGTGYGVYSSLPVDGQQYGEEYTHQYLQHYGYDPSVATGGVQGSTEYHHHGYYGTAEAYYAAHNTVMSDGVGDHGGTASGHPEHTLNDEVYNPTAAAMAVMGGENGLHEMPREQNKEIGEEGVQQHCLEVDLGALPSGSGASTED